MTIVTDDECDGQPRIDGTTVTVTEIYHRAVQQGRDPAKVAHKCSVGLARVHEAIAFYYDHRARMRELEDWGELAPAIADRDDWEDMPDLGQEPLPERDGAFETPDMNEYLNENQDADEL